MGELEREEREFFYFFSLLLSKIYENRIEVFVGEKGKVDLRIASYAWVLKS